MSIRKSPLVLSILIVAIIFGFMSGERYLSSTGFCLSCHSMQYPAEELKESSHFGALGVNPECADCHLPPDYLGRIRTHLVDGTRAVIGELRHDLSSKENFEKLRPIFAHNARINLKKWDSSSCRRCHKNPQPPTSSAMKAHKKMETEGATCIDCHQNLVHKSVPEEDLNEGLLQARIVPKKTAE